MGIFNTLQSQLFTWKKREQKLEKKKIKLILESQLSIAAENANVKIWIFDQEMQQLTVENYSYFYILHCLSLYTTIMRTVNNILISIEAPKCHQVPRILSTVYMGFITAPYNSKWIIVFNNNLMYMFSQMNHMKAWQTKSQKNEIITFSLKSRVGFIANLSHSPMFVFDY